MASAVRKSRLFFYPETRQVQARFRTNRSASAALAFFERASAHAPHSKQATLRQRLEKVSNVGRRLADGLNRLAQLRFGAAERIAPVPNLVPLRDLNPRRVVPGRGRVVAHVCTSLVSP